MSRPVIHAKRWHGFMSPTLAACGLWLATACGDNLAPEQEQTQELRTQAQAAEADSCDPDTVPPVLTCDAEAFKECGGYITQPANFEYHDNCGFTDVSYPYPIFSGGGNADISVTATARDVGGHNASCTTVYHVRDTQPPEISLAGPAELTLTVGSTYEEQGASYYDYCMHGSYGGGGMSQPTTGSVNTNVPGTYVLTYSFTDYTGHTGTAKRTVKVVAGTVGNTTQSRLRHTSTLLGNGRVLVVGGYSRTAEEYNPATRTFTAVGAPLFTHRGHTATLLQDGTVLVAGGAKPGSTGVEELYNPATGQWSRTGRMSTARYDHTAVLMPDGRVLVAGGGTSEGSGGALASAEIYDPATRQWTSINWLNVARRNHTMTLLPFGNNVLVTGGIGADGALLASTEVYHLYARSWEWARIGDLATARANHTATRLPDGNVLLTGGQTQDTSRGSTSELFDANTYTWSFAGWMSSSRQNHTASLVNGKVLITGGYNAQMGILYDTELYDPSLGWRGNQKILRVDRYKHTATVLDANTVLLVGGFSNRDQNAVSAELYTP